MKQQEILKLFLHHKKIHEILKIIESLQLREGCLCAGTIRNNVWNLLEGREMSIKTDVDVAFFDPSISYEDTCVLEGILKSKYPQYPWELKNQAHMHLHNPNTTPFLNVEDAISHFPETCTAVGVRLYRGAHEWITPYGLEDIFQKKIKPTPTFQTDPEKLEIFKHRIISKNWLSTWSNLEIVLD